MRQYQEGQSKGYGFVKMPHYHEAMQAVQQLDKSPYMNKTVDERFKSVSYSS